MTDLMELASRVEAGEGPDRELDKAVATAIGMCLHPRQTKNGCQGDWGYDCDDCDADSWGNRSKDGFARRLSDPVPAYTASLDAAMSLIEADEYWRLGNDGEGPDPAAFKATVTSHDDEAMIHFHDAVAETAALALCCAALRARARQGTAHVEQ